MLLQPLNLEVGGVAVEYRIPSVVPAWHVSCEDALTRLCARMIPIHDLGLLEDPQVKVGLRHPLQIQLESDVPPIQYIKSTKTYNSFLPPYLPSAAPYVLPWA